MTRSMGATAVFETAAAVPPKSVGKDYKDAIKMQTRGQIDHELLRIELLGFGLDGLDDLVVHFVFDGFDHFVAHLVAEMGIL